MPFSEILYTPIIDGKIFQNRVRKNKRKIQFINVTKAEHLIYGSSIFKRGSIPIFQSLKYKREPKLFFQERTRLFFESTFKHSKLSCYLANGDYIREKADRIRREAQWRIRHNRRYKIDSSDFIFHRPYRKIQLAEYKIGRRSHPWRSNYQRVLQRQTISLFSIRLRKKWEERKHILFFDICYKNCLIFLEKRNQRNRFCSLQKIIHLNFSSFSTLKTSIFFLIDNNIFWFNKRFWGYWKNLNLPLLVKEIRKWLILWNQRNLFLLGEIRRAGSLYQNCPGRQNFSWWRLIRPVLFDFPISKRQKILLPWQYINTFFHVPIESNTNHKISITTNTEKIKIKPNSSFLLFQPKLDQRTFSVNWLKSKKRILSTDCTLWLWKDEWSYNLLPLSIFFIIRVRSVLRNSFNSVQHDFVYALYQLILRGGRIEIEPEWIEWLLNILGFSDKNARIRIYLIQKNQKKLGIKQIVGLEKEVPTFLKFLLYLRSWKRKILFLKENRMFGRLYPSPTLLVGVPGTGKTSLIQLLANEAKVSVIYQCLSSFVDASTNFTSSGFGRTVTPRAVQRGFCEVRSNVPAIFFLDEIDVLRINRSISLDITQTSFYEEKEMIKIPGISQRTDQVLGLGQLLVEVDREIKNEGVVLFRATNQSHRLDPAMIRPGRFHQILVMSLPNKKKRGAILKLYLKHLPKLSFFINTQKYSQKKRSWEKWLILTKAKSPSYLMALRNVAILYKRTRQSVRYSLEQSFEVIWNRIVILSQLNLIEKFLEDKKNCSFYLRNFLEFYYRDIRTMYWKYNLAMFKKKDQTHDFRQKEESTIRTFFFFQFRITLKLFNHFSLIRQTKRNLILTELKKKKFRKEETKYKNVIQRRILKTQKFPSLSFLEVTMNYLLKNRIDIKSQRYDFEFFKATRFRTFSWVSLKKYVFQNYRQKFNSLSNLIKNSAVILKLRWLDKSRRTLDFFISKKIGIVKNKLEN